MKITPFSHHCKQRLVKPMVSAVIFITTLLIGGTLVIFALNSNGLDSFRSGTNGNTLTANNRNDLITYVQVHDTVLGALLLQLNATFSGMQGTSNAGGGNVSGVPINGVCGAYHGLGFITMPTSNLCFAGSGSAVVSGANGWTWKCKGINGGFDVDCFSQKIVYSCQGTIPNNAEFCSGSDQGLTTMTHTQIVSNCGEYKCAYTCKSGYTQEGDTCSVRSTSRYPGCDTDDILHNGYIVAACNVGSHAAGPNNYGIVYDSISTGICANGYHVPTFSEWRGLAGLSMGGHSSNLLQGQVSSLMAKLFMPYTDVVLQSVDKKCVIDVISNTYAYWCDSYVPSSILGPFVRCFKD